MSSQGNPLICSCFLDYSLSPFTQNFLPGPARLPIKKTLDDFDFSFQPSIDKRQIDELATMRFLENGENVVFLGPPGVGKTHLASAILDRVLHHCTVINIKGESYRLKERKEFMRQKQQIVNTLFDQGNA